MAAGLIVAALPRDGSVREMRAAAAAARAEMAAAGAMDEDETEEEDDEEEDEDEEEEEEYEDEEDGEYRTSAVTVALSSRHHHRAWGQGAPVPVGGTGRHQLRGWEEGALGARGQGSQAHHVQGSARSVPARVVVSGHHPWKNGHTSVSIVTITGACASPPTAPW